MAGNKKKKEEDESDEESLEGIEAVSDDEWAPGAGGTGRKRKRDEGEDSAGGRPGKASTAKKSQAPSNAWTEQEDADLKALVDKHGPKKWAQIAEELGTDKMPKQCRRRWKNRLATDFRATEWTEEEDRTLLDAQKELGNRWTEIARRLVGRTDNAVKNRFISLQKRASKGSRGKKRAAAGAAARRQPESDDDSSDEDEEGEGAAGGKTAPAKKKHRAEAAGGGSAGPGGRVMPSQFNSLQIAIPDDPAAPPPPSFAFAPSYPTPTPLEIFVNKGTLTPFDLNLVNEINSLQLPITVNAVDGQAHHAANSSGNGGGGNLPFPTPIGLTDIAKWLEYLKTPRGGPSSPVLMFTEPDYEQTTSAGHQSLFRSDSLQQPAPGQAQLLGTPGVGGPQTQRQSSRLGRATAAEQPAEAGGPAAAAEPAAAPAVGPSGQVSGAAAAAASAGLAADTPRRQTRKMRILGSPRSPRIQPPSPQNGIPPAGVGTLPSPFRGGALALLDDPKYEPHRQLTYRLLGMGLPSLQGMTAEGAGPGPEGRPGRPTIEPPDVLAAMFEEPETWTARRVKAQSVGPSPPPGAEAAAEPGAAGAAAEVAGAAPGGAAAAAAAAAPAPSAAPDLSFPEVSLTPHFSHGEISLLMELLRAPGMTPHGGGAAAAAAAGPSRLKGAGAGDDKWRGPIV